MTWFKRKDSCDVANVQKQYEAQYNAWIKQLRKWQDENGRPAMAVFTPHNNKTVFTVRSWMEFPNFAHDFDELEEVDTNARYVCYGSRWNLIEYKGVACKAKSQNQTDNTPRPTNCKNCGAVLHGNVCEYCGTEYGVSGDNQWNVPDYWFTPNGLRRNVYAQKEKFATD